MTPHPVLIVLSGRAGEGIDPPAVPGIDVVRADSADEAVTAAIDAYRMGAPRVGLAGASVGGVAALDAWEAPPSVGASRSVGMTREIVSMTRITDRRASAQPDPPAPRRPPQGPKIHRRVAHVEKAARIIGRAILDVVEEHGLTMVELLQILVAEQASWLRHALREERHPKDPDSPADIA